uniref:Uncharacterized protein n=1 Tax=Knipowitschia caucasica TaxID=637954 RepID=A0AAV2JV67_KNICA
MQWLGVHFWTSLILCTGIFSKESTCCEHQPCQNGATCETLQGGDVVVDSRMVVPTSATEDFQANITVGCSNKDKCAESPCLNRGRCVSRGWRSYTCECHRPYEGDNCEQEYATARFGRREQQSYAVFSMDDDVGATLTVSMFVRTKQSSGLLLIMANSTSQYLRVWLDEGRVHVQINNFESLISQGVISDGHFHLLTVQLVGTTASLYQSAQNWGSIAIRHIQANSGDAVYVGGVKDPRASASFGGYFKGCIQDFRVNSKRLQFYPIAALMESYNLQQLNNVEQGCSSDNTCDVNPCLNGGACYSMWDDFLCTCPPNTAGRRCEEVKWCDMSPCPVSATCLPHSMGFDCLSNVTIRTQTNPLHYRGLFCHEPTDRCLSGPCMFGNCTNLPEEYKCDCEPGHGGKQCELELDFCENNNCSNGATCLKGLERYTCLCPQNLTGRYCNEKLPEIPWYIETKPLPQLPASACIDTSMNYSCFNGGNCSKGDTKCLCLPGFIGQWCEKDVDECSSEPCLNGGFCVNYINSFECVCDVNFSGLNCQIDISDFYLYMFLGLWQNLFQLLSYLVFRLDDGPEVEWGFQID